MAVLTFSLVEPNVYSHLFIFSSAIAELIKYLNEIYCNYRYVYPVLTVTQRQANTQPVTDVETQNEKVHKFMYLNSAVLNQGVRIPPKGHK